MKINILVALFLIILNSCNTNSDNKTIILNEGNSYKLIDKKILNGKIHFSIPSDFELMNKEVLEIKYPSSNRPTEVYTDSGTVSIAIRENINAPTTEGDLPKVLKYFIKDLERIAGIKWYKKEMKSINQKQYCFLEFETPAIDTHIYNLMLVSNIDGHLFIVSFNCPVEIKNEWKPKGYKIINSIKLVQ